MYWRESEGQCEGNPVLHGESVQKLTRDSKNKKTSTITMCQYLLNIESVHLLAPHMQFN